jgi:predicted nucleic acid-binding protein
VYLDPSAWVKRYYHEPGTELTNQLFDTLLRARPPRLLCSRIGMPEVVAVLHRHRNAGRVTQALFNTAYAYFEEETRHVRLLPVRNHQMDASIRHLLAHSLNATDALHLQVALEEHSRLQRRGPLLSPPARHVQPCGATLHGAAGRSGGTAAPVPSLPYS